MTELCLCWSCRHEPHPTVVPKRKGCLLRCSVPRQCWRTTGSLMQIKATRTAGVEAHQSYGCLLFHFCPHWIPPLGLVRALHLTTWLENSWQDICCGARNWLANASTFKGRQATFHYIYICGFLMTKSSVLKRPQVTHTFSRDVLVGNT